MSIFSVSDLEILLRLVMAAVLCGMIGYEYKSRNKTAGIRTSALIGMGAALLAIASIELIIVGIGMITLGAIMQSRGIVKGLTTAASIWITAAIGIVIGMGMYGVAVMTVIITIIIITILRNIDIEEEVKENMPR